MKKEINYTVSFDNSSEAANWFSMMGMKLVRKLPASYVGSSVGDEGEKIAVVAMKSGINTYDMTERYV